MNIEEKATMLQYKYEETFDNIRNDDDLITEAIRLSMVEYPNIELDEATVIADEVLNLYNEIVVI